MSAAAIDTASLGWGVKYNNPDLPPSAYSGSVSAVLWAVLNTYAGGSISGYALTTFNPTFTGSGAHTANQVNNRGYSVTQVQSSASQTNPPLGSDCIVATLERYDGG